MTKDDEGRNEKKRREEKKDEKTKMGKSRKELDERIKNFYLF
jgi:hypothetical protein